MEPDAHDDALGRFLSELVALGQTCHVVLGHMEASRASGGSAPGAPPPPLVLGNLLMGVLRARREVSGRADLDEVAGVLGRVHDAICDELFLVNHEYAGANRAARRRRRRRGHG